MSPALTRPICFGVHLRQIDNRWESTPGARLGDDLGFHAIRLINHLLLAIADPTRDIFEAWPTMTACAALTRRVRLSANVRYSRFRSRGRH